MNIFQIMIASNSDAREHLVEAKNRLQSAFPNEILFSESFESKAVTKLGEELLGAKPYLNALCLAQSALPLESVQSLLKKMEAEMGRKRGAESMGMVAIDLDLVLWNNNVLRIWDTEQAFYQKCLKSLEKMLRI